MSFVSPASFLWLLPLGGAIFLLYLLKMRRKELHVPASFLWPKITHEVRANSLFQRPRITVLLVLQLLVATLLIAAFARPQIRSQSLSGQTTVFVVDASASMAATDVRPSRIGQAVSIVRKFVDAARPGDPMSVIEAGPTPRVIFPLSDDPGKMRRSLDSVQTYDSSGDVGEALRLAASLVAKSSSGKIVLLSDGVFGQVTDFTPGKAQLVFQKIGNSGENSGITALGLSDSGSNSELYCGLRNYGHLTSKGVLDIYADGVLLNSMKVEIPAKTLIGKTMPAPSNAKVFEARLDNGDNLSADNYAVALRDSQSISVLLVGPGDLFLERALSIDPRVTLYKSQSVPNGGKFDVVVFDGVPEVPVQSAGVLDFGAAGAGSPAAANGSASDALFKSQVDNSPLLNGVSLDKLYLAKSQAVFAKPDAKVLAEGSAGPIIVERETGKRQIYVSFSPLDSDFPLRVGFPIFIDNALSFLAPKETASNALLIHAGRTVAFPAGQSQTTLKRPDGATDKLRPTNGQYVLRDLGKVGRYELGSKPAKTLYVTFGSEAQSNIEPVDKPNLGSLRPPSVDVSTRLSDWWKPIILFALLILGIEWFIFARMS